MSNELLAKRALQHARGACSAKKSNNKWHVKDKAKQARCLSTSYALTALRQDFRAGVYSDYGEFGDACEQEGVGNCGEMGAIAQNYVLREGGDAFLIAFAVPGDHAFAVVGFQHGDEQLPMSQWNDEAFICDPWANIVCKPAQYLFAWKQKMRKWRTANKKIVTPGGLIDPTSEPWFSSVNKQPYLVIF
jgi:hypothetical protein